MRILLGALAHADSAVRHRVARIFAELATVDCGFVLNGSYTTLVDALASIDAPAARAGAIEALALMTTKLSVSQQLTTAPLLAPCALAALADPLSAVRELAAVIFGRLVGLMHLAGVS